jgi:ADP-ribose pyrophosphatase
VRILSLRPPQRIDAVGPTGWRCVLSAFPVTKEEQMAKRDKRNASAATQSGKAKRTTSAASNRAASPGRANASEASNTRAKALKAKKGAKTLRAGMTPEKAEVLSSEVVYEGPLFRVHHDRIVEPGGLESERDVIRHNGSVVILAMDKSKNKRDPWIVMERQYRHAANQFLWELPAGKLDAGEDPVAGAKRELAEETGYSAKKWSQLVEYYPSPGFLGEPMKLFLAEGLVAGEARPEEDERIDFRLVRLSDILKLIEKGGIHDGKTLSGVLLYAWLNVRRGKS